MTSTDDHDLVCGLKANNEKYHGVFVDRYAGFLIEAAQKTGLPYEDAKVAANEAFYKSIKNIQQFDINRSASFKSWLFRIVKNCAFDLMREKKTQFPFQSIEEQEEQGLEAAENIWQETDCPQSEQNLLATEILNKAMQRLSPTDQQILMERACGRTHKEIGEQLNKKEGAVKVANLRALAKLKKQYIDLLDSMEDEELKLVLTSYLYGNASEEAAN
ncbi:MAG: hypothetical protein A2521_02555 [Deltaproteobacteria bacterium RIFOXYD12_FULL_57_12]|nr:MAG: hypothetical protein A2521_02555 [Deltaproteobacteria bacterium RIFOXYD12_FULL_57_12]